MTVEDAHTLLIQDTTISPEAKNKLTVNYPCCTDRDKADFLAAVLFFGMEREFRKRDVNDKALLASGSFSPLMRDFIFDVKIPRPCRNFCGRDAELEKLHELLCSKGKVYEMVINDARMILYDYRHEYVFKPEKLHDADFHIEGSFGIPALIEMYNKYIEGRQGHTVVYICKVSYITSANKNRSFLRCKCRFF